MKRVIHTESFEDFRKKFFVGKTSSYKFSWNVTAYTGYIYYSGS